MIHSLVQRIAAVCLTHGKRMLHVYRSKNRNDEVIQILFMTEDNGPLYDILHLEEIPREMIPLKELDSLCRDVFVLPVGLIVFLYE